MYNYCFKVVKQKEIAEELVQETFMKFWENISKINLVNRSVEAFLIVTPPLNIIGNIINTSTNRFALGNFGVINVSE